MWSWSIATSTIITMKKSIATSTIITMEKRIATSITTTMEKSTTMAMHILTLMSIFMEKAMYIAVWAKFCP